jgi:hypothetical protein
MHHIVECSMGLLAMVQILFLLAIPMAVNCAFLGLVRLSRTVIWTDQKHAV